MIEQFDIPKLKKPVFGSDEVSLRLKSALSKWANFALSFYSAWDEMPQCGHFFGGVYNYEIETTSTMAVFAVLSSFGDYDERIIGTDKETAVSMVISCIRYLCYTHYVGPAHLIRGKSRNPMTSEKKWGFTEGNFFMSSQTGFSVAMLGLSALLLWDRLDDETRMMVCNVLVFYADHFSLLSPGNGVYNDTQCEENAWTALGISAALYLFPHHENHLVWEQAYISWTLNSVTTPDDKLENELDKVSYQVRNGFEVNQKTYGISAITFHPDFTAENHGYVHPDYISAGISIKASSCIFPLILGKKPISVLTYNFKNLYDKVIKPWSTIDGNCIAPEGQDWFYHRHGNRFFMHSVMDLLMHDPIALKLKLNSLDIIEKRQHSTTNGSFLEKDGDVLQVNPGKQTVQDMEYGYARSILLSYILHLFLRSDAADMTDDEVLESLKGNYMYPYGNISVYRTPETFASFSSRGTVMGLSLPENGMWDITPAFSSFTGIIKERKNMMTSSDSLMDWSEICKKSIHSNIKEYEKGFSSTVSLSRAQDKISQLCSFNALPDGNCIYIESLFCPDELNGPYFISTGLIGVGNENIKEVKSAKGYKDIYFNSSHATFLGNYNGDNIILEEDNLNYVNVDCKIGYLLFNSNKTKYINKHKYDKWKGLEDMLLLNTIDVCDAADVNLLKPLFVLSLPNHNCDQTLFEYIKTIITSQNKMAPVIRTASYRVAVNFSHSPEIIQESFTVKNGKLCLYNGISTIINDTAECKFKLDGFSSQVTANKGFITFHKEDIHKMMEVSVYDDNIFINNHSDREIVYTVTISNKNYNIRHMPKKLLQLKL